MSTTPRTPVHFPRMKNRAAGRAIRKQRRLIREASEPFMRLSAIFEQFAEALHVSLDAWQKAWLAELLAHQEKTDA